MGLNEELLKAVADGDIDKVKKLLEKGANINAKDLNGATPLHKAVISEHIEIIELLLEKGADVNAGDNSGNTPLHYVATTPADVKVAEILIKKGADVNAKNKFNETPLILAIKKGYFELAKLLIEHGANIKDLVIGIYGMSITPLHYAAWHGYLDIAKLLIEKGVDVNAIAFHKYTWKRDDFMDLGLYPWCTELMPGVPQLFTTWTERVPNECGLTPLHFAAIRDKATVAALLIRKGADINARACSGATPLHWAAVSGSYRTAELLIEQGADVNARDYIGRTPLHYAKNGDVAQLLIDRGVDVNAKDKFGLTPLHLAIYRNHGDVVFTLLSHGADVNAKTALGLTPLHLAAYYGNSSIAEELIKRGANVDEKCAYGYAPIHYAVLYCGIPLDEEGILYFSYRSRPSEEDDARARVIAVLIEHGAIVNARDNDGKTPLHHAARECLSTVARLLIRFGADVNARDKKGNTPLHYVTYFGCDWFKKFYDTSYYRYRIIDMFESLLANGAEVNAVGEFRRTPLHLASASGNVDFIKKLINHGAKINLRDALGYTPLHYASAINLSYLAEKIDKELDSGFLNICSIHFPCCSIKFEHPKEVVELLLRHGADVNAKTNKGVTPLHIAVLSNIEIIEMLIRYGADVNAVDGEGNTPLHYAFLDPCVEVVKLLLEKGADPTIRNGEGISALDIADWLAANLPKFESHDGARAQIDKYAKIAETIREFARRSRGSGVSGMVCPHCGKPVYRLRMIGRYYCFNCKKYV